MPARKPIQKVVDEYPEIRVVLEIAARARETEAKQAPRELGASTDVAAIPNNSQFAVQLGCVLTD